MSFVDDRRETKNENSMPFHRWDSYSIVEKIKENLTNPFELDIELSRIKKKNVISREDFFVKIIKIRIFEFLKPSEKKKRIWILQLFSNG